MTIKIDETLKKQLQSAARRPFNFVFSPGATQDTSVLKLSKKRLPDKERTKAKLESGGTIVFSGVCRPEPGNRIVFETKLEPKDNHQRALEIVARRRGGMMSHDVVLRQNGELTEEDFEDDKEDGDTAPPTTTGQSEGVEDTAEPEYAVRARQSIGARTATIDKGLAWLEKAQPPEAKEILEACEGARKKLETAASESDFEAAVQLHDEVIEALRKVMRAAAGKKEGTPEQTTPVPQDETPFEDRLKTALRDLAELRKLRHADPTVVKRCAGLAQAAQSHRQAGNAEQAEGALAELCRLIAESNEAVKRAAAEDRKTYEASPLLKRMTETWFAVNAWRGFDQRQKKDGIAFLDAARAYSGAAGRKDFTEALNLLNDAEALANAWDRSVARVAAAKAAYEKASKADAPDINAAARILALSKLPPAVDQLAVAFRKSYVPFVDAVKYEAYDEAIAALPGVADDARKLLAAYKAYTEAEARFVNANKSVEPAFVALKSFAADLRKAGLAVGERKVKIDAFYAAAAVVAGLVGRFEFDEAVAKLPDIAAATKAVADLKAEFEAAGKETLDLWTGLKADFAYAQKIPDIDYGTKQDREAMVKLHGDLVALDKQGDKPGALAKMKLLVAAVAPLKAAHEKLERERADFDSEWAKIADDYALVRNLGGREKKIEPLVAALAKAHGEMKAELDAYRYVTAKSKIPAVRTAVTPLLPEVPKQEALWAKALKKAEEARTKRNASPPVSNALRTLARECGQLWGEADAAHKAKDFMGGARKLGEYILKCEAYLKAVKDHDKLAEPAVKATAKEIEKLVDDEELQDKSFDEKKALLERLRAATTMPKDARKAQARIYKTLELDPDFNDSQDAKIADAVLELTDTKVKRRELREARKNWGTMTETARLAIVRKALLAHCKSLGLDVAPEVETFAKSGSIFSGLTDGYYSPGDRKIHLNTNSKASFSQGFAETMDVVFHENSHYYQDHLVARLDPGHADPLDPNDPEYAQAQLFALNSATHGYVKPDGDFDTYKKQPLEEHAHRAGPQASKALLAAIKSKKDTGGVT